MLKIAIVIDSLDPYRIPVYTKVAQQFGLHLHVICREKRVSGREQSEKYSGFDLSFIGDPDASRYQRIFKDNLRLVGILKKFSPDVIVTEGFAILHLYAFSYAVSRNTPHVYMMDGTRTWDGNPGFFQKSMHRFIYEKSKALIAVSQSGLRLFARQGVPSDRCFVSSPCIDNAIFNKAAPAEEKKFDFIFSGLTDLAKNPLFALEVSVQIAKRLKRKIKVLFIGSGELEVSMRRATLLFPGLIDAEFYGTATPHELLSLYRSARLLLHPSIWDPWSVVVNEACAAGLPVMVSPLSGTIGELVRDGENGFVCDLDVTLWVDKAERLLTQPDLYQKFSLNSQSLASHYSDDRAAVGLVAACQYAWSAGTKRDLKDVITSKPRVVIVERQLLQYRVAFYNRLRALLEGEGIELQLLIGNGTPAEEKKMDQVSLDWTIRIPTRYLFGTTLCWQPFGAYAKGADLVIVMHENKIIYNLWLLSFGRPKRLAFWGHGRNMQSDRPDGVKERFKRWTVNKVDWWFAYTESSADLVTDAGFPRECTTVVENAVDTEEMTALCKQVSTAICQRKREELSLGDGPIAIYLGSLYKEKRLDFLLEAAFLIREKIPEFQLLVVGAGPEQEKIERASALHSWIHYLGPLQDQNKAVALVLADVMLNPGLVGLGILDSFASGTPMFTTDCGLHSPEISYMLPGKNGVMTSNNVKAYADAVISVLSQPEAIGQLSDGALSSAPRYTVDNMAERIHNGIRTCLAAPSTMQKGRL